MRAHCNRAPATGAGVDVRQVDRQALVPFSPQQMFDLVDDVASYPQFLPWCRAATVLERKPEEVVATLQIHKGGLHTSFTTRNRLQPPHSINLALVNGPFRALDGEWQFQEVGDKGSRVRLKLRFGFANPLNAWLLEPVFEHTCNSLVDAFVKRARSVYV